MLGQFIDSAPIFEALSDSKTTVSDIFSKKNLNQNVKMLKLQWLLLITTEIVISK